ncbi:hypothetical protein LR48_Vigan04g110100 [Vigna angularis]|uniref:Uncharacterized protein n=1 Tax=Phaseolus angularis TaxID=3914 RepID=A0A0L9UDS3_PHAAN|nr:hypothetical protein LR48_Vigan04g110100 [Vigna angularis]
MTWSPFEVPECASNTVVEFLWSLHLTVRSIRSQTVRFSSARPFRAVFRRPFDIGFHKPFVDCALSTVRFCGARPSMQALADHSVTTSSDCLVCSARPFGAGLQQVVRSRLQQTVQSSLQQTVRL